YTEFLADSVDRPSGSEGAWPRLPRGIHGAVVGTSGNLRITITREEDTIVVALVGDLDVYVAADARQHLDEAIDRAVAHGVSRLTVDASALGFCDSTGLSIILRAGE